MTILFSIAVFAAPILVPIHTVMASPSTTWDTLVAEHSPALAEKVTAMRLRERALRAGLATDSFTAKLSSVLTAGAASTTTLAIPSLPIPDAGDIRAARGASPGIRAPVAGLLAAVHRASEIIGPITARRVARTVQDWRAFLVHAIRSSSARLRDPLRSPAGAPQPHLAGISGRGEASLAADSTFRMTRQARAALLLGAALDRYLPALRSTPSTTSAASQVTGCDLLDRTPYLCVGSDAGNTYTASEELLIDLGGDDAYLNSAGGAPFLPEGSSEYANVSLNIDLAGDDHYATATPLSFPPSADWPAEPVLVGEGAALGGTVGILVDDGGDDTYSLTAAPAGNPGDYAGVVGQGAEVAEGLGALFDLGGSDRYAATAATDAPQRGQTSIAAQGASGGICSTHFVSVGQVSGFAVRCNGGAGAALQFDRGGGDDDYIISGGAARSPDDGHYAFAGAMGQGLGLIGSGVLSDDGGTDSFSIRAAADDPRVPTDDSQGHVGAVAWGQAYASQGLGALLEGPGNTTYTTDTESTGFGVMWDLTQGEAGWVSQGAAVLSDEGGDDAYRITAIRSADVDVGVSDECGCESAAASISGLGATTSVHGQGAGYGGDALLLDGGGADRYSVSIDEWLDVDLSDELTSPTGPPTLSVKGLAPPGFIAQGAGTSYGAGVLVDRGGERDTYKVNVVNATAARASSAHAAEAPRVAAVSDLVKTFFAAAQGAASATGQGALVDEGGSGDTFLVDVRSPVVTSPDPNGAFSAASRWPASHGAGSYGMFVARGTSPDILSVPSPSTCTPLMSGSGGEGLRGFGRWADCAPIAAAAPDGSTPSSFSPKSFGEAFGYVPEVPTTLAFAPDSQTTAPLDYNEELTPEAGRLHVRAVLLDGTTNNLLPGVLIHFSLEYGAPPLTSAQEPTWVQVWDATVTTNDQSVAEASLPLWGTGTLQSRVPSYIWRVVATFDGTAMGTGSQHRGPRHVAQNITLTNT